MFPFYCNQCFRRRKVEESLELHVSRCGHILCKDCLQENCCICGRPFKSVPINKDMPQSMAEYFSDPIKQYQHYQKVMRFHHEQECRLVQHLCKSNEEEIKKVREERQAYIKIQETLKREIEHERERIRKLQEYITYHERRLVQTRYMTPPITAQPRPRYPSRSHSMGNVAPSYHHIGNIIPQSAQPLNRYMSSPSLPSTNSTSSATVKSTEVPKPIAKKQRTPPPLLPFSQHKMLKQQFSLSSMD